MPVIKISDLLPKPVEVDMGGGNVLVVKALDLKGITRVIQKHRDAILHLITTAQGGKPDFAAALDQAPDMVATVIAMAADAEGQEEDIKQIPGAVQLIALAEIWKVSVPDVKKLLSSLSGVMGQEKTSPPPIPSVPAATTA